MAQLRKVLLIHLVLFLFASLLLCAYSESQQTSKFVGRRKLLGVEDSNEDHEDLVVTIKPKKKLSSDKNTTIPKNQPKPLNTKPNNISPKNQTKLIKTPNLSSPKNQTKIGSKKTNTTTLLSPKIELKKLNSTSSKIKKLNSTATTKPLNSTKSLLNKKSLDLTKNNKTTTTTKKSQISQAQTKKKQTTTPHPSWFDLNDDGETDFVSEITDLPLKFQQSLIPDLERISTTSKAYLNKANKEITKGFKPIVGQKYAPTVASLVSFAFMLIPLLLVSLLFTRIKAYFSLQKLLIFVQVYLSIYFFILCLSSLVTGLEPLRFFYGASRSTYVCVQLLQTLAYVLYLLLLLMYLILVFSTDCGLGSKMLGLAQTLVGFAVGLHYYVAVFHRVVLRQPPRTNWKVHGVYATCFFLICLFATAERRKKAYLEDGGEEGKKN